jgi:hypothetical protein
MNRTTRAVLFAVTTAACATGAHGQSWRLRLDAAAQRVEFRGVTADSIPESAARIGAAGGLESPDGFAVDCVGDGFCRFFRPGPIRGGLPTSAGMDLTLWGLGLPGLSVRVNARALTDLTGDRVWPGTSPTFRLVEGYAEYLREGLTVQAGRMIERGRLASAGTSGLDGVRTTWRSDRTGIEVGGYAGWGMARGTILPVTSPAVDPLADYQPSSRQIVVGALAGTHLRAADIQVEYRRELDPVTDYIVAERAAVSLQARPERHVGVAAGTDYDIAQGEWGSAEASVSYTGLRVSGTITARHYRPFFDLWTVWGVFSPVPFNGVSGSIAVNPTAKLRVRSRSEWFRYDAADVSAPNVTLKDRGWRWALEGTLAAAERWTVELDTHGKLQPGASSSGIDGRVMWRPHPTLDLSLDGGNLERPLELRFQDAGVTYAGASAAYRVGDRWRLDVAVDRYWESRNRPDAAAFDWNQWRLSARASLTLRSAADRWLPPARPQVRSP